MKKRILSIVFAAVAVCVGCGDDAPGVTDKDGGSKGDSDDAVETPAEDVEPLTEELRPLLVDGRKWIYGDSTGHVAYTATIVGDTVFEGGAAKIMRLKYADDYKEYFKITYPLLGRLHHTQLRKEENCTIYQYTYNYHCDIAELNYDDEWDRGMDINRNPGEEIPDNTTAILSIESRGTVAVMGKMRRALKSKIIMTAKLTHQEYDYWIEGIGSTEGLIFDFYKGPRSCYYIYPGFLLECWDGDKKIFDWKEFDPSRYTPES